MRPFFVLLTALLLTLVEGTSAAELPDIGDSAGAYISPEQERKVGEAFFRDLRGQGVVVEDPELQAYIQSLGEKLSSQTEGQTNAFTFFLVNSPVINAFAVPGGFVGVHTALVLDTENESELASVLAHEISHITQRHGARMFEAANKLSIPSAVAMLGAILLGVMAPGAGQAAIAAVAAGQEQFALNFTRANEEEADRIGMQLLARSGFNPEAMPDFFERLQTANRYNDPANVPEFLRDHPVTTNRIADARARADQYPRRHYKDSAIFYLMKARIRVLTAKDPQEALRYYEDALREGQYRSEEAARYGYAIALTEANEYGKARLQLQRLLQTQPEDPSFLLASAQLDVAEKNYPQALARYARVLHLYPGYRPAIIGLVETLLADRQPDKARATIRDYMSSHEADPRSYKLLAEAEGRLGATVESHIAQAEYYYLDGDLGSAIEQLKLAKKVADITYYQRERVEARLDQFQKEFDEEKKQKRIG